MSEPTAALVTLQRLSPLFPPVNSVSAAVRSPVPACQCSGSFAIGITLQISPKPHALGCRLPLYIV
ncbi:MAG: hypothetical protein R3E39_10745 [Anaerolineae bacterium]